MAVPQFDTFSTLLDMLRQRAESSPNKLLYSFLADGEEDERPLTYGQLDQRARQIAALLQQQGKIGDRALLLYPPGLDYIAAFFGCLYAGWIAVPSYPPAVIGKTHVYNPSWMMPKPPSYSQTAVFTTTANIALTTPLI
ncbi:MAG: AMP-binding protein [Chloroflexi bacterium]|nr:AMP-binding protein [Chloroflexota bacterium]